MNTSAAPAAVEAPRASRRLSAFEIPEPIPGFYSAAEVIAITSLSKTGLWRLARAGLFPASTKLSARRVGWSRQAVHKWIAERMEAADVPAS